MLYFLMAVYWFMVCLWLYWITLLIRYGFTGFVLAVQRFVIMNYLHISSLLSHVPEWERHPEGTFLPPKGCAFSQNVQCQLETICPLETDIATTKSTESEMSTIKPVSKLPSLTAKVRVSKDNQVTVADETTPVTTIGSTPEQEEITQHIIIHVRRPAPENKHSAATSSALSSLTLALSFVFSIIFMNCYFKTHLI